MNRYALAVFDFDGTLVDTSEAIALAVNDALAAAGLPQKSAPDLLRHVGLPLPEVLSRCAPDGTPAEKVLGMVAHYRSRFRTFAEGRTRLFDGIAEALVRIADAGVRLAIATSRGRGSLEEILAAHGLRDRFSLLVTAEAVKRGKPHPEMLQLVLAHHGAAPGSAVMVGDTIHDLQMGRAAGTATCAVTWGMHPLEELAAEGPTHVARRPAELAALLLAAG